MLPMHPLVRQAWPVLFFSLSSEASATNGVESLASIDVGVLTIPRFTSVFMGTLLSLFPRHGYHSLVGNNFQSKIKVFSRFDIYTEQ